MKLYAAKKNLIFSKNLFPKNPITTNKKQKKNIYIFLECLPQIMHHSLYSKASFLHQSRLEVLPKDILYNVYNKLQNSIK